MCDEKRQQRRDRKGQDIGDSGYLKFKSHLKSCFNLFFFLFLFIISHLETCETWDLFNCTNSKARISPLFHVWHHIINNHKKREVSIFYITHRDAQKLQPQINGNFIISITDNNEVSCAILFIRVKLQRFSSLKLV